jgi:hypothetical protein
MIRLSVAAYLQASSSVAFAVMPVSSENQTRLLLASREAASTFVEDMAYIRDTVAKADKITPGELRRLSAVLRRLLIDNDLRSIAPPRIGRLSLLIPDNDPIYHAARKQSVRIFASGGIHIFNNEVRAIVTGRAGNFAFDNFDKTKTVAVSLDGFLNQRVLAQNDEWATRGQVIKYIANSSSGVHSKSTKVSSPPQAFETVLSRLRKSLRFTKEGDSGMKITVDWVAFAGFHSFDFKWMPDSIDSVLIELLCSGHFLAISPDIHSLELAIHKEFGFPKFDIDSIR